MTRASDVMPAVELRPGWAIARLSEMTTLVNGFPFASDLFEPVGEVPLVRIRDIQAADFGTFVPRDSVPRAAWIQADDLVIGMDGDFNTTLWRREPAALNQRVCLLRAKPGNHIGFISYLLPELLKVVNDLTYATTVKHLSSGDVTGLRVARPGFVEQRQIAAYLDAHTEKIDALIRKQEMLIGTLAERRRAAINHAVTKGLEPEARLTETGVGWLGQVPESWRVRPLWSMFERVKDVGHPEEPMLSVFREYGVVLKEDHANLNQTAENRNIYQLVGPGWLVTNRMKAWQGSVGISGHRGIVSGHYICFEPRHPESSRFLNYLFRSAQYAAGYATLSRGVRIGQAEIDNDQYRLLPVLVPPRHEQDAIVEHLDRETSQIDALSAKAREMIDVLKERRQALISAAVTGKIDVRGLA